MLFCTDCGRQTCVIYPQHQLRHRKPVLQEKTFAEVESHNWKDKLTILRQRITTLEGVSQTSTIGMVSSCDNPTATASFASSSTQAIDSGATDHATSMHSEFHNYTQQDFGRVKIADGAFTWEAGKGSISVLPDLSLSFILHVPCFSFNLLSVSSLTKHLNCSVTFYRSHCVFEDLKKGADDWW